MLCCAVAEPEGYNEVISPIGQVAMMEVETNDWKGARTIATSPYGTLDNIRLVRLDGQTLGLKLDNLDNTYLLISDDPVGIAAKHNEDCASMGCLQLRGGHFITRVNGARGSAAKMLRALTAELAADMDVWRPELHTVTVDKLGGGLGMDVNFAPGCSALQVLKVSGGAMAAWNAQWQRQTSGSDPVVRRGDCILRVNGKAGPAKELLELIQAQDRLELLIARPPPLTEGSDRLEPRSPGGAADRLPKSTWSSPAGTPKSHRERPPGDLRQSPAP
mmetsp:Transcript_66789/g.175101  ORF Transcript_66789/g.175101 Transcript_66789/m.175101 type:complete len:275 (+) Transcript_66789:88-912(+)